MPQARIVAEEEAERLKYPLHPYGYEWVVAPVVQR